MGWAKGYGVGVGVRGARGEGAEGVRPEVGIGEEEVGAMCIEYTNALATCFRL